MKKRHILPLALMALIVGGTLALRLYPRTLRGEQCSEVYQRYHGREGVRASFIKDKRVDDSVVVDMTLLEATTDSAWALLQRDFNIAPLPPEVVDIVGEDGIECWAAPKIDYALPMDSVLLNNDEITCDRTARVISVFHIQTEEQIRSIRYYNYFDSFKIQ